METNVTIISTNLSKKILNNYSGYHVIDDDFVLSELLQYKKVIFFNILNNLKKSELENIFKYLKENNILFINVVNNLELSLYTDKLIIYDGYEIVLEGNTIDVLKEEKLIKRIGLQLPFMVELSILLKDYGLLNKIYLDKESLVDDLWK